MPVTQKSPYNALRVMHVIDSLDVGGTEKQCLEIIRGLHNRGLSVYLAYFRGGALLQDLREIGITHKQINIGAAGSASFWRGVFALAKYMRMNRIDVAQTYGFYSNVPGIIAAKLARVPVIITGKRD